MTHNVLLSRPQIVLEVHRLDSADIVFYKTLMLPSEGIEPAHLEAIKHLVKDYFQDRTNAALRLYKFASDQDRSTSFFMAGLERKSAMKKIQEC